MSGKKGKDSDSSVGLWNGILIASAVLFTVLLAFSIRSSLKELDNEIESNKKAQPPVVIKKVKKVASESGSAPIKVKTTPINQLKNSVTNQVDKENYTSPLEVKTTELDRHIQRQDEMLRDQLRKAGGKSNGKIPPKEAIDEITKSGRVIF